MDRKELYTAICRDLEARKSWDDKQSQLYRARYRGLRRVNLPWPGASDINWPLADTIITKLAPYYFGQLYATDLVATFFPTADSDGATAQFATAAAQWFDFQIKQESNFETAILQLTDYLLMLGRPVMKITWDPDREQVHFTPIEPSRIIVPSTTTDLDEADSVVHVLSFSVEAYKRQPGFNTSDEFLKRITRKGTPSGVDGQSAIRTDQYQREGITDGMDDEVIVWEVWTRADDGKTWEVEWISPTYPDSNVKAKQGNPYEHGRLPFVDAPYEVTQPHWTAPRGITEVVLTFQAELTKLLNEKNDALTLSNRPLLSSDRESPNTANLRWKPGQIIPGIRPIQMPTPPISFDVHMNLMREVAEALVATPDFGMARATDMRKARTATEMEQIQSLNSQSTDLKMRVFRMALGRMFQVAWEVLKQYASNRLTVWVDGVLTNIPAEALKRSYKVRPSGSADGVTRQTIWRKAVARLQMFANDPHINQAELRKSVLEADEAGLVKRLFQDTAVKASSDAEDQAMEIAIMALGFPALVTRADNHAVHIQVLQEHIMRSAASRSPGAGEIEALMAHAQDHFAAWQQSDPKGARAGAQQFAQFMQQMGAVMGADGQQNETTTPQTVQPPRQPSAAIAPA